jgi:ABC-type cobalamin/Fe3+-siderophores transport system ATPase subunit
LIGSDVQDWDKYEECNFGDLKFPIDSYSNFIKLIDKDINLINDLIKESYVEDVKVYGDTKNKKFEFMMPIYNDVNVIFGDKGSGKSEILKSLKQYFNVEKSLEPVFYEGGSKDKWFSELLKKNSTDFDCSLYGITDKKHDELFYIKSYKDSNPKSLSTFINYFNELSSNKKRKNMAILNIEKTHSFDIVNYNILKNEYNKIKKFYEDVQEFNINKSNLKYDLFNKYLKEYKQASFDILRNEFINQYSFKLFDECIEKMNSYVSDGTGTPPQPTETGFATFAKNRIGLLKKIETIRTSLSTSIESEKEYIGDVGTKGKGYVKKDVKLVNSFNISDLDYKRMKSNKTDMQTFLGLLEKIKRNILKGTIMKEIYEIGDLMDEKQINDLDAFLFVSKEFHLGDSEYNPSKGEKAILALQYELLSEDSSDIYLIDEPELSLGSMYIEENIVPLIRDLSKRKKIVVVATHDANIAIRTRPVNTILKTVDNNSYLTFIGSMFTSELRNIIDIDDIRSWRRESIKHLEGGEEAFEERGYLYEKS